MCMRRANSNSKADGPSQLEEQSRRALVVGPARLLAKPHAHTRRRRRLSVRPMAAPQYSHPIDTPLAPAWPRRRATATPRPPGLPRCVARPPTASARIHTTLALVQRRGPMPVPRRPGRGVTLVSNSQPPHTCRCQAERETSAVPSRGAHSEPPASRVRRHGLNFT